GHEGAVSDEGDIKHELIALGPRVAPEHFELSLIWGGAEDRVERGRVAGAVGPDESQDAALFDTQIDPVQRDGRVEDLAEAVCFYAGHRVSAFPAALAVSGRAAEWLRRPWAIGPPRTSGARPRAADCARRV